MIKKVFITIHLLLLSCLLWSTGLLFAEGTKRIPVSSQDSSVLPWFDTTYKEYSIKDENVFKRAINFIPVINHLYSGQWRKGVSDLWNFAMLGIQNWHIDEDIVKHKQMLRTVQPQSRQYDESTRKTKQFEELRTYFSMMILMNYLNSVLDAFTAKDDNSFLGVYYAGNGFSHNSYAESASGIVPFNAIRSGSYWGIVFGYQNMFEYYADMISPTVIVSSTSIFSMTWSSDFIVPYKFTKNLDFYLGLGFNQIEYHDENNMISSGGCGLGFHPRIGVSYLLNKQHYFRLNVVPYMFWGNVKGSDPAKTGVEGKSGGHERTIIRDFADDYGFQFIYGLKIFKRLYLKTNFVFSKVTESGGDFVENNTLIHLDKHSSYMNSLDLSLNYAF